MNVNNVHKNLMEFFKDYFVIEICESGYIKYCCLSQSMKIPLKHVINAEVCSDPSQTSTMELFVNMVKGFQPLSIFAKKLHLICFTGF